MNGYCGGHGSSAGIGSSSDEAMAERTAWHVHMHVPTE